MLIEQAPVARIFTYCDDADEDARGRWKVGGLSKCVSSGVG
jgi:hypothetical protein